MAEGGDKGVPKKSEGDCMKKGPNIAIRIKNRIIQLPVKAF